MGAIDIGRLMQSGRRVVDAALLGETWAAPLDDFARAAGAAGATLVGEGAGRTPVILATPGVAEGVADYLAGRAPPDARAARVHPRLGDGFRADFDDFSPTEIARNPYYVDFLRRLGLGWHATARLAQRPGAKGAVFLSLKRAYVEGHYECGDLASLALALPRLREAAQIAQLRFDGEGKSFAQACGDEARAVFALDGQARARALNAAAARLLEGDLPARRGRLSALAPESDARLQALLDAAVTPPRQGGAILLEGLPTGRRLILRALVLDGVGRDLFAADVALLFADPWRSGGEVSGAAVAILRAALGLTQAEATVAALLADGASANEIAAQLAIAPGTARNHLKSGMAKAETSRQAEYALLCGRLTG